MKALAIALVVLVVVVPLLAFVLRRAAAPRRTVPSIPVLRRLAPPPSPPAEEAAAAAEIDVSRIEGRVEASSLKKVGDIVEKHPGEAVSVLRRWLHSD